MHVKHNSIIIVILSLTLTSILVNVGTCAKIQSDGGYDLVFAIKEGTQEPENVTEFLENIETNLRNFSTALHVATHGRFFVNSVDLILPYHWEFWDPTLFGLGEDEKITATRHNYQGADVRLSSDVIEPQVENPNVCGLPGEFIQLPLGFFQDNEKFGPPYKALLNAFARYRWGTHEEFGYPGDHRFPYFYKDSLDDELWKAVGCSNGNLTGEYVQSQNSTCVLDDELYPPGNDCHFIPNVDDENEDGPTSSISYLPWLESVVEFCDEDTHNFDAPTKQNIYCGYRSIQQVLENSPDFPGSSVTVRDKDVNLEPPEMTFNITVAPKHPTFYLLVDSGRFSIPQEFMDKILEQVKALLEDEEIADVISYAGVFNSKVVGVQPRVEGSRMGDQVEEFKSVVDEFKSQKDAPGNFALALEQVITTIRAHGHSKGAIILVLKHGASPRDFGKSAYESDLLALLRQEKINLHAIEIELSSVNPQVHLKQLAERSGGFHTLVSSSTPDITATVRMARAKIVDNFETVTEDKLTGTLFKGFLPSPSENFSVPFHQASLPADTEVVFSLTLTNSEIVLNANSKLITLVDGPENAPALTLDSVGFEWDEKLSGGNRKTAKYTMKMSRNNFPSAWSFTYDGCIPSESEGEDPTCSSAFLLISYSLPSDTIQIPGSNLQVSVWTSPQIDKSSQLPLSTLSMPLTIFAKILQKGSPLLLNTKNGDESGDQVIATFHSFEKGESLPPIFLDDDGASSIDITENDGIYSGIMNSIPENISGKYRLTVEIRGEQLTTETDEDFLLKLQSHKDSAVHRLLPQDPLESIGCPSSRPQCLIAGLERSVVVVVDHPEVISINEDDFKTRAARITDFNVDLMNDYQIRLSWHEPGITVHEKLQGSISFEYEIRSSNLSMDLKTSEGFENATPVPLPEDEKEEINRVYYDKTVFKQVILTIDTEDTNNTNLNSGINTELPIYFAIRLNLVADNPADDQLIQISEPSNIVSAIPVETPQFTTTTTTTTLRTTTKTTTPITKYTTTTLPTTETGGNSTTEYDEKSWYEEDEAIITFSVFGAGMLIMIVGVLAYCILSKKTASAAKQQDQGNYPYNSFS